MAATTFTVVNDVTLVASITATAQTLVYVAPGITKPVVDALAERLDLQSDLQCTRILDLDPEVYRLGYLFPSRLCQTDDKFSLVGESQSHRDFKSSFVASPSDVNNQTRLVAFLALVIARARG